MNLSEHFTLSELTASDWAARNGVDNTPPAPILENLKHTAEVMENIRSYLGFTVHVNSGYRSGKVNAAVGGKPTSLHCQGLAVDFTCKDFGTPFQICEAIEASGIGYDKLIYEFGSWVHIQFGKENRRQNFTINSHGTHIGFHK